MSNVFSRILVGVDDSETSLDAVRFAARLAKEHAGDLIICHSVNWIPVVANMTSSGAMVDTTPVIDELKAEGEALLDRAFEAAVAAGVTPKREAFEGSPVENLLDEAATARCSLIVMGTHSRHGLERLVVGSTTAAVLRASAIPVLTLHAGASPAPAGKRCFERIVAGIDASEPSAAAVQTVLDIAAADRSDVLFYSVAGTSDDAQEQAHRVIGNAVSAANERDISAKGHVIAGVPDDALVDAAQQQDADLIVLGSHGRHGFQRMFLGSVAEGVVRKSLIPVLVVRTHAAEVRDQAVV